MPDPTRTPVVETAIAAPFEVVWRALRDPIEIRRWHGWDYDGLDDEIKMIYLDAAASEEAGTIEFEGTSDRFEVDVRGDRTVVRVTREAPGGEGVYDEIEEGWITFVTQLRFALEHHRGRDRHTLHLDGAARAQGGPLTPARLGLDGAERAPAGAEWQGTAAWGEALSGAVVDRSGNQVALSVGEWGDALLALQAKPAEARPPHGGGRAIVSVYRLDDASFAALQARLAGWWEAEYEPSSG
jgi:hypothetical protein